MGKNERIDVYVHRIKTLARKKLEDDVINENKDLMRKFLETVLVSVSEALKARRKEKMRWVMNGEEGLEFEVYVDRCCLEHVLEFKYLGCVFDEAGTDRNVVGRKRVG